MAHSCLIALGSNLGDRLANLQAGVRGLTADGLRLEGASGLWESEAFGGDEDRPYLNAVIEMTGVLDPWNLLALCKTVERDAGRDPLAERNAPRCLDLDVLAVEGILLRSPTLSLPHPRIQGRAFVWRPLAELSDLHRFGLGDPRPGGRGELTRVAGRNWLRIQNLSEETPEVMP
jgi:2-amino-4-hydroxy-6-hydroxymethyldihydropteridine diphosphokinase